ncbi:MAG TPA: hypothetical protein VM118_03495 [Acidobacteriota bacterium]|nr:hypothetical protein [Acidobacteriota bacterium]
MRCRVLCVCILFAVFGEAAAGNPYPRVERYELDVRFVPLESSMTGKAVVHFAPDEVIGDEVVFYLHAELDVDSVLIAGQVVSVSVGQVYYDCNYALIADELMVSVAGRDLSGGLTVYYSGYFHPSAARSASDYMRIDDDGVFLRAYGYSLWFPVFLPDEGDAYAVMFADVIIRTPAEYHSVFLGTKKDEYTDGGERVTAWSASGASLYNAQCTAQRYTAASEGNCFVYRYADAASEEAGRDILTFTNRITGLFQTRYRRSAEMDECYVIEMPRYGDISSGNVTGLMASTWREFRKDAVARRHLAHELVHPFVRVPVARADSLWSLAIEGFPTYFHLPILAEILGWEFYDGFIQQREKMYLEKRRTGKTRRGADLPPEIPLLAIAADEMSTYKDEFVLPDRAVLFLNYLYQRMGREAFFAFTSDLFNRDVLTAGTFRAVIEKYLPGSRADVEIWLSTTEYPERFRLAQFGTSGK